MKYFTLALCGSFFGCGDSGHQHDSMSMTDTSMYEVTRTATTDGGTWSVTYVPEPDPIPVTDNFKLYFTISEVETGTLVAGAQVSADASMPEHNHGMNTTAVVTEVEGGQYEMAGMQFHMPGHWRIDLEITASEKTEMAEFHVDCCE